MPSLQTPLGLVAVFSVADGWRASVQQGNELTSTRLTYQTPRAALLALSRVPADTPWLVELETLAVERPG